MKKEDTEKDPSEVMTRDLLSETEGRSETSFKTSNKKNNSSISTSQRFLCWRFQMDDGDTNTEIDYFFLKERLNNLGNQSFRSWESNQQPFENVIF